MNVNIERQRRIPVPDRPQSVDPQLLHGRSGKALASSYPSASSSTWPPRPNVRIAATHARTHSSSSVNTTRTHTDSETPSHRRANGEEGAASAGGEHWKTRIHREVVLRFRHMTREADEDLRAKLALASREHGKKLIEEHRRAMEALAKAMEEEEAVRIREEEGRRRVAEAGKDEEEWIWRPDGQEARKTKSERWKEAMLTEQQVIWDAIKNGVKGAGRDRSHTNVSGHKETDGFTSDTGAGHQGGGARKARWATHVGTTAKQTTGSGSQTQQTPTENMFHERWIPSVNEYAADMREQAAKARSASFSSSSAGAGTAGAGSGDVSDSGGWRDWRHGVAIPESMRSRRAQTPVPVPTQVQSPRVRQRTSSSSDMSRGVGGSPPTRRVVDGGTGTERVGGVYQRQLDDMAARLKRELSIQT